MSENYNKTQWQIEEANNYTHPLDAQLFADRYIFGMLGDIRDKQILDIGCGNAYLLIKLEQSGANGTGLDNSFEMLLQARQNFQGHLCLGTADILPFATGSYDAAICSLTINNFPSADITKHAFQEAFRVLKPGGIFIFSLPHPHTLNSNTRFRWTEWEEEQNQDNLVPGEGFRRKIMGSDGKMISIVNYYWPKQTLCTFAQRAGFIIDQVIEARATDDEILQYSNDLEPIYANVPFFIVIRAIQKSFT